MSRATRPIFTLDCETDPFKIGRIPEPFLWGIYDGHNYDYWQFETVEEVVSFLRDRKIIVYAHNGGKFDYHYLRQEINADDPVAVISGRLAKFRIGECECRDSLNLFGQTRLKDFEKMKIDYKLMEKSERYKPENWKLICEYLKSDCVNLWNLVNSFVERYGMHFTQAGASMKYWSKTYKKEIPKSSKEYYDSFHPFYYGGRVQCFAHGHKKREGKLFDMNSAYPRAMCDLHPYSTDAVITKSLPKERERIGSCLIELEGISAGALPKYAEDGGLYFPDDRESRTVRNYKVTGWELLAALETNSLDIQDIVKVHKFCETTDFKEYINTFYTQRKEAKKLGDKALDIFCKIFMNSLYGKFAANPEKYQEYVLPSEEKFAEWLSKGWTVDGNWCDRCVLTRPLPEIKHRYYNIATAASITGWVRAFLWRAICAVKNVLYCDTDSIFCDDAGDLEIGSELGQWKLEFAADEYAIAGKKTYAMHMLPQYWKESWEIDEPWTREWKIASKGVRLTPVEVIAAATGSSFTHLTSVPNYSIHAKELAFLHRLVRNTYKDVSIFPEADSVAVA